MQPQLDRSTAISTVEKALGPRNLIWLGKRGEDAAPLLHLEQFSGCFSMFAPLRRAELTEQSIETLTGRREDTHDLDGPLKAEDHALLSELRAVCDPDAILLAYRPYACLWSAGAERLLAGYRGCAYEQYSDLGSKPLVERALKTDAGVGTLPWCYVENTREGRDELKRAARKGPIVLRPDIGSGGDGLELLQDPNQVEESSLVAREASFAWSPFLTGHVPVNVGGCVFPDGGVTLHTPSLQLIGLPQCTPLRFGYCGNDFGAVKHLDARLLDELERVAEAAGAWLHGRGYIGAFGMDAMVGETGVLFTEINARFQGSSRVAASLEEQAGLPDIYLDHLMAWLGMKSHATPPLRELARGQAAASHVVCYNLRADEVRFTLGQMLAVDVTANLVAPPDIKVAHNSVLCALRFSRQITADGTSIDADAAAAVESSIAQARSVADGA